MALVDDFHKQSQILEEKKFILIYYINFICVITAP